MRITTPLDEGDRNGGGDPTATTQGAIAITKNQDSRGDEVLTLQPLPRPMVGTTAGAAGHAARTAGRNGARGEVTI